MELRVTDVSIEGNYNEITTVLTISVNDTHTLTYATNHGQDRLLFDGQKLDLYRESREMGLSEDEVGQLSRFCYEKVEALHAKLADLVAENATDLAASLSPEAAAPVE